MASVDQKATLQLEIPPESNPSLPVWDAIRQQLVNVEWTVNPYSICVSITPDTPTETQNTSISMTGQMKEAPVEFEQAIPKTHFHTRSSSDVKICEEFLLNTCPAGEECPMHHTQYPFHWQLWSISTHQWIDIPPHAQICLEKKYCDFEKISARIRDQEKQYVLSFETMELKGHSRYSKVRRLANSDKMLFYWWKDNKWEKYEENVCDQLLKNMKQKMGEFHFQIDSKNYKVNFKTMKQTNVSTKYERSVRCRPFYHSPDCMLLNLNIATQEDPTAGHSSTNFNVDAMKDFTSWYPPMWSLIPEPDYSLVNVPAGTKAYSSVLSLFFEGIPETRVDIVSVQQVQNVLHWDKYQRHKVHLMKKYPQPLEPLERHLFHGTTKRSAEAICQNNFDPRLSGEIHGTYGSGTYFAVSASLSHNYTSKSHEGKVRYMFLAKVLVGKYSEGDCSYTRPPLMKSKNTFYDSCVNRMVEPSMFVVFDSCQCYPSFLIKYKNLPSVFEI